MLYQPSSMSYVKIDIFLRCLDDVHDSLMKVSG